MIISFLTLFSLNGNANFSITADTTVVGTVGEVVQIPILMTSDSVDQLRRIYVSGGGSSQTVSCIKTYTASETCSFTLDKTFTTTKSIRIYLYPKNSPRVRHTILLQVEDYLTDLAGALELSIGSQIINGSIDFGAVDLQQEIVRKILVKNIQSKTTAALNSVALLGSGMYSVRNDTCAGKNLRARERCTFEIVLSPGAFEAGTQSLDVSLSTQGSVAPPTSVLNLTGSFTQTLTELPANIGVGTYDQNIIYYDAGEVLFGRNITKTFFDKTRITGVSQNFQFPDFPLQNSNGIFGLRYDIALTPVQPDQSIIVSTLTSLPGTSWSQGNNVTNPAKVNNMGLELENRNSDLSIYEYFRTEIDQCISAGGIIEYKNSINITDVNVSLVINPVSRSLNCFNNYQALLAYFGRVYPAGNDLNQYLSVDAIYTGYSLPAPTPNFYGFPTIRSYILDKVNEYTP